MNKSDLQIPKPKSTVSSHYKSLKNKFKSFQKYPAGNDNEMDFNLEIYSNKFKKNISFGFVRTAHGWLSKYGADSYKGNKTAEDSLLRHLRDENISYPYDLGDYLESVWKDLKIKNLSFSQAQLQLSLISEWISVCEKSRPDIV